MALTARFVADFSSFEQAVAKAEVSLKSFEQNANKVGSSLNRMTDSLSGRKLISEATLMATAVEKIGGPAKLTAAELQRVSSQASEAAAKMKALGIDVPPKIKALADQVQPLPGSFSKVSSVVTALGGALGLVFTGTAILNGIKNQITAALDYADSLALLKAKTELSYRDLQILEDVGINTGVSIQSLASAVQILQMRLGDGSAKKGIKALGLEFDALKRLAPAEQLTQIGAAIASIHDPTERAKVAAQVFGRTWKEILPALKANMAEAAAGAKIVGDAQIDAADRAGDRWDKFWNDQKRGWASWAGDILLNMEKGSASFDEASRRAALLRGGVGALPGLPTAPGARIGGGAMVNDVIDPTMISNLKVFGKTLEETAKASDVAAAAAKKHADSIDSLVNKLGGQEAIGNAKAWMSALTKIGGLTRLSEADQKELSKVLDAALVSYKRLGVEAPLALQKLADASRPALTSTNLLVGALGKGPASLSGAVADTSEYIESYGRLLFTATEHTNAFGKTTYTQAIPALGKIQIGFEEAEASTSEWNLSLGRLSKVFAQLSQTSGGSMGKIAQSIGTVITSMELASIAGKDFSAALLNLKGKGEGSKADGYAGLATAALAAAASIDAATNSTSKAANIVGGAMSGAAAGAAIGAKAFGYYGAAVGAVAGALVGLAKSNASEGKHVSPLRDEFFKMAGGLEKLNPLVEKLTGNVKLVQNVFDARTVQQYNSALAELNRLFEFQNASMQILDDTVKKYNLTVEEMGPAFQRQELHKKFAELFQDYEVLTKAGGDHVTVLGKMADDVNAYIADAVKMGVEVPESMRPMLQKMVDSGLLLDASGKKFGMLEDAGIVFGRTMTEVFTSLIDEVKKLTDAITRGLGGAIQNVPDVEIRGTYSPPKNFPHEFPEFPAIEMAKGGRGMVKTPTLFLAGEGGAEEFAFSGSGKRFGAGSNTVDMAEFKAMKDELQGLRGDLAHRDRALSHHIKVALQDTLAHGDTN